LNIFLTDDELALAVALTMRREVVSQQRGRRADVAAIPIRVESPAIPLQSEACGDTLNGRSRCVDWAGEANERRMLRSLWI